MNLPHIFSNPQFKRATIAAAIFILILLTTNIFVIGGDSFVRSFNSSPDAPLAIIVTVTAASIWRQTSTEKQLRHLWTGLVVGWALWALAEIIWAFYSILGQEVPYPSLADLFWVVGYIPMGIALLVRIRTMPAKPTQSQNLIIWGVSAATILITSIFVFIPVFQGFDPQRLVESILNLIYPLADLFLVIIVWRMFLTLEKGDYGFGWRLVTVGLMLMTFSDLSFTYATWQELYYPNMEANTLSRLVVDVPYTVSYLILFLGIYALRILLSEQHPIELADPPRMVPLYGHILIYTKSDNTVMAVSPNFDRFFKSNAVKGKSLAEVLTISDQDEHAIFERLQIERKIADLPIQIQNHFGVSQRVELCGMAIHNPRKEYSGANILLRIPVEENVSFDEALCQDDRSMVKYLLNRSGSNYKAKIGQFLLDYYLAYIKALFKFVFREGGETMSQSLLDGLLETSKKHNWQMRFNLQTILDGDYSLEVLREALPILLETAKQFASGVTDPEIVGAQMQTLSMQFSEAVHRDVAFYCEEKSEVRFAANLLSAVQR